MKLKSIANFWMPDKKRGTMTLMKKGQEFEIDHSDEGELIYNLLRDLRVTIIDSKFVLEKAEYICLHEFSYENQEGLPRYGSVRKEITLGQEKAVELMVRGFIKPADDGGWVPAKLLGPILKEDKVKKMFDFDEPRENRLLEEVRHHRVRGGHE